MFENRHAVSVQYVCFDSSTLLEFSSVIRDFMYWQESTLWTVVALKVLVVAHDFMNYKYCKKHLKINIAKMPCMSMHMTEDWGETAVQVPELWYMEQLLHAGALPLNILVSEIHVRA